MILIPILNCFHFFFDLSGAFYIFGATFVLPILSIVLVFQIKKVMHKSIKIRNTNKKDAAAAIRNVRIHLGQILIASYTFICLFPNILYFIRLQGTVVTYSIFCFSDTTVHEIN